MFIFRFVSCSVYYGLNFNTRNLAGDRYLNVFISGIVEIPALVIVLCTNNRFGRRRTTSVFLMIASLTCFSILGVYLAGELFHMCVSYKEGYFPSQNIVFYLSSHLLCCHVSHICLSLEKSNFHIDIRFEFMIVD